SPNKQAATWQGEQDRLVWTFHLLHYHSFNRQRSYRPITPHHRHELDRRFLSHFCRSPYIRFMLLNLPDFASSPSRQDGFRQGNEARPTLVGEQSNALIGDQWPFPRTMAPMFGTLSKCKGSGVKVYTIKVLLSSRQVVMKTRSIVPGSPPLTGVVETLTPALDAGVNAHHVATVGEYRLVTS